MSYPPDLAVHLEDRARQGGDMCRRVTRPVKKPYWSGKCWFDRLPAAVGRSSLLPWATTSSREQIGWRRADPNRRPSAFKAPRVAFVCWPNTYPGRGGRHSPTS